MYACHRCTFNFAWGQRHASHLNEGGHVRYTGGVGNWLITIAPYFIPTISILAILVTQFMAVQQTPVSQGVIGATVGFHLGSSYLETHDAQSDLKKSDMCSASASYPQPICWFTAFSWHSYGTEALVSQAHWIIFEMSINAFQWVIQKPSL